MADVSAKKNGLRISPKQQTKLTQFMNKKSSIKALAQAALSPSSGGRSAWKKRPSDASSPPEKRKNQHIIDAGQKECGPRLCSNCGLCYDPDDEMDNVLHQRECLKHGNVLSELTLMRKMNCMQPLTPDIAFVHCATPKKPTNEISGVKNILRVVEKDFGSVEMMYLETATDVVLFYLDTSGPKNVVVGCLAAEEVSSHSTWSAMDIPDTPTSLPKTMCGVYLLWVAAEHRRSGVATKLVDCLRKQYTRICRQYGQLLLLSEIAFSVTTTAGDAFVNKLNGGAAWRKYSSPKALSPSREFSL
ncbi:hypothetical protein RvY_02712 [Ramazzottius varieornatus]|uniref:N-acetyltransferase domain-containing protein n=1 Tax=Ramazzottius varieornatus TaxID=947166 RepID=A0A1D1UKP7_RAMVA|nr:hypothetical protein RvY_02712 [Ramazzottius varieornatus]